VHVAPETSGDVPDSEDARLVVIHPKFVHARSDPSSTAMEFAQRTLTTVGNGQRTRGNTIVFVAADRQRYEELDAAVREFLAWSHIAGQVKELNLTPQQSVQAHTRCDQADDAVTGRINGTYTWAIVPEQPVPSAPAVVVAEKVGEGRDALAKRVSDILERRGLLTAIYGALRIRMALDGPLAAAWADGHISVGALWDLYTRYPYLDRLRDRAVLIAAIRSVLSQFTWEREGFALAATYDNASSRYTGLVLPGDPDDPMLTDDWLLVRPDRATAQREADKAEAARPTSADQCRP